MKKSQVKVAIIDNSVDHSVYTPVEHWSSFMDVNWEAFRAKNGNLPDLNKGYSHLILTGSEASILDREKWVYDEIEVIRDAVNMDLPVLGSCYGHQLLAVALAGVKYVRRCHEPEIGWITISIDEKREFFGERGSASVYAVHFDEVFGLGSNFSVLASSNKCRIHAFQFEDKPVWGIQAHPEIRITEGQEYLRKIIHKNRRFSLLIEQALSSIPKDSGLIYPIINKFLDNK